MNSRFCVLSLPTPIAAHYFTTYDRAILRWEASYPQRCQRVVIRYEDRQKGLRISFIYRFPLFIWPVQKEVKSINYPHSSNIPIRSHCHVFVFEFFHHFVYVQLSYERRGIHRYGDPYREIEDTGINYMGQPISNASLGERKYKGLLHGHTDEQSYIVEHKYR